MKNHCILLIFSIVNCLLILFLSLLYCSSIDILSGVVMTAQATGIPSKTSGVSLSKTTERSGNATAQLSPDLTESNNNNNNADETMLNAGTTSTAKARFYFVRHGESGANKWGLIAGQDDVPLTKNGIVEAKLLGSSPWIHSHKRARQELGDEKGNDDASGFWKVYSSDLSRAKDTAILALREGQQQHHIPNIIEDYRLRERLYGPRQGFSRSMPEEEILGIWKQHGREPPRYESDEELWERGKDWMEHVLREMMEIERLEKTLLDNDGDGEGDDDDDNNGETKKATTKIYHILVTAHAGLIREILLHLIPNKNQLVQLGAKFDAKRGNKLIIPNTSVSVIEIMDPSSKEPFKTVNVVDLLNADHLQKINVYDD